MPAGEVAVPRLSLTRLFLKFLRFGCLAFGGPVAQIAMLRQSLVEEERWIEPARFNRLLAVMQALPGPEAHELCVHFGIIARGRIGGLLAGLGFMLPGFLLMLGFAWAYASFAAGHDGLAAIFLGVQVGLLAIIARAVQRIGSHILITRALIGCGVIAAVATLAGVPFWVPLVAAGIACALPLRPVLTVALVAALTILCWLLLPHAGAPPHAMPRAEAATLAALFVAGLKGGLLTFGGAYTAIPYVRADTVERGWLDDGQFLDGVAIANVLPAPLVIFATFAGFMAAGLPGALLITAGMFLPAFAFSLIFFERLEAVVEHPRLFRALDGVAAAAVGIIGATLVQLGLSVFAKLAQPLAALPIFAVALLVAFRVKGPQVAPALILASGIAGWLVLGPI